MALGSRRGRGFIDIWLLAVCGTLLGVTLGWAHPCPVAEGHVMACHWAYRASLACVVLVKALAIVHLFFGDRGVKQGIAVGIAAGALLLGLMPGVIVSVCQVDAMQCRMVMQPALMVGAGAVFLSAVADFFIQRAKIAQAAPR